MISDLNLALDFNLSGLRKGCGLYPDPEFLGRAARLHIPIAVGSDCHEIDEPGGDWQAAVRLALEAGYRHYVTFSRGITEKRPLAEEEAEHFRVLNLGVEMLKLRFEPRLRQKTAQFSFGGSFRGLLSIFDGSVSLGEYNAVRVRRDDRSITLSDSAEAMDFNSSSQKDLVSLYSHHTDTPGTLSILFNTLASERFFTIESATRIELPPPKPAPAYLLEVDGVSLPIPISNQMVLTVHNNRPGVLLILLSALASRQVNVLDLQLGRRGERGFAVLGIQGDERQVADVLTQLGPQFYEATQIVLRGLEAASP